jgi:hypothetical protein
VLVISILLLHKTEANPKVVVGNKKDSDAEDGVVPIVNIEDQNKTQYYSQNFDAG